MLESPKVGLSKHESGQEAVANHWVGRGGYLAVLGRGQLASQGVHTLVHPDHLVLCLFPPSND